MGQERGQTVARGTSLGRWSEATTLGRWKEADDPCPLTRWDQTRGLDISKPTGVGRGGAMDGSLVLPLG